MKTLKIAVVMGGDSPEHDISIKSGTTVLAHLHESRYERKAVVIQQNGLWSVFDGTSSERDLSDPTGGMRPEIALKRLVEWGIDVAFLALHGPNGEDGAIQGFFQIAGIPYTGSGIEACAASMNKNSSRMLAAWIGLKTAPGALVSRSDWASRLDELLVKLEEKIGFPLFVKPLRLGSSIGMVRVKNTEDLKKAIQERFQHDGEILIEQEIYGREITCGVLGSVETELTALPPVEIRPKGGEFFDFESKYDAEKVEEICPAPLSPKEEEMIKEGALTFHKKMGAKGFSRIDFILNPEGLWFLELNAIPGLTPESILLKEAAAAGITLENLFKRIILSALSESHCGYNESQNSAEVLRRPKSDGEEIEGI